mmetsp:Transcript_107897/g.343899  ORF Transcript_107897/g.343899 Transcript_107897/m.343899 type:complete len:216 (+) Transcript_107897:1198-1845(+)
MVVPVRAPIDLQASEHEPGAPLRHGERVPVRRRRHPHALAGQARDQHGAAARAAPDHCLLEALVAPPTDVHGVARLGLSHGMGHGGEWGSRVAGATVRATARPHVEGARICRTLADRELDGLPLGHCATGRGRLHHHSMDASLGGVGLPGQKATPGVHAEAGRRCLQARHLACGRRHCGRSERGPALQGVPQVGRARRCGGAACWASRRRGRKGG